MRRQRRRPGGELVRVHQHVERAGSASSRTTSPSRSREIGPPCTDSGVTWIAAGMAPEAPDMRPSVTQRDRWPALLQHAERGRQRVQLGHPVGRGPLVADDDDDVAVELAPGERREEADLVGEHPRRRLDDPVLGGDRGHLDDRVAEGAARARAGRRRARTGRPPGAARRGRRTDRGRRRRQPARRRRRAPGAAGSGSARDRPGSARPRAAARRRAGCRPGTACRRPRGSGSRRRGRWGTCGQAAGRPPTGRRSPPTSAARRRPRPSRRGAWCGSSSRRSRAARRRR